MRQSLIALLLVSLACCTPKTMTQTPIDLTIPPGYQQATFAAGCFWCIEAGFESLSGVHAAISGYAGGHTSDPTYEQVSSGTTGHAESIRVIYDPAQVSFQDLLEVFWRYIDPTDANGQYVDRGSQYRTIIFYHDQTQLQQATSSLTSLSESGKYDKPIVTEILPVPMFYPAEEYHQDYYKKAPQRYQQYKDNSGRPKTL